MATEDRNRACRPAALDPKAQPYQDLLDKIIYRLAGLADDEAVGLERRLETML